ncbi:MAG: ribonuclease J [Rhodospirillales bacterium]|nr:ribonuclease J [Rhodospirillales bacterium]
MSRSPAPSRSKSELVFVALGGAGEIGMNLNLYGYGPAPDGHQWLMVDLGVTFGDGRVPGVDVIMPDPAFIAERRSRLLGLVLTHAHEDHLGAVPYLWDRLRCPVYATPFAVSILSRKLREAGMDGKVPITVVPLGGRIRIGPFDVELVTVTHSIPEPNALAIRTPHGTVVHTGDWKFDPEPVVGPLSDEAALRRLGDEGVLAIVCDSTNVFTPGVSGSEAELESTLTDLIREAKARVAVACFATNVARLETIARAAAVCGRDVVIAGRSLRRIDAAARENGYLAATRAFLDEEAAGWLPPDRAVIICTGSQGEPRAALARIAADDHPNVTLGAGDLVIFSSRVIPGNETAIAKLQNDLVRLGVKIVTWRDHHVHVSGHPARDELARMYQLVRPRVAVPVHGELRHMLEHADLARDCQVPEAVVSENGGVIRLAPGRAEVVDRVPVGRLAVDGNRLVPLDGALVRDRNRAIYNGSAVVTVVLDARGRVKGEVQISTLGVMEAGDEDALGVVRETVEEVVAATPAARRGDDAALKEALRIAVRRAFRDRFDKRPVTSIHLVRV